MTPSKWEVRQKFHALLDRQSEFETTRDGVRFTAKRRGNQVIITPSSTGNERPVSMDAFIDGYLLLLADPNANTTDIGGVNASYVLTLCRALM